NCPGLIKFPPETTNSEVLVFPSLRELHITSCPQLVEVLAEALPLLRDLGISKCGDGVLRSVVQAAPSITILGIGDISGLTYKVWSGVMEHLGAVEEVSIWKCNEIRYLWESEEEASKVLVNIKKLEVRYCSNLVSLGEKEEEDNFGRSLLSSLRTFSLTHVSFPTSTAGGGGQKLKSLDIVDCRELMEKINNINTGVLESIRIRDWADLKSLMQFGNFIYLTQLHLEHCPSLESFPDIPMPVLTNLTIRKCERMKSLSAHQLRNLTQLKCLKIKYCPSIDASSHGGVWPPNLSSLRLRRLKKPMSEWGPQSFPSSLVELKLYDEPDLRNFSQWIFPSSLTKLKIVKFEKLESLSMGLQHLTSLQHLFIDDCPKMKDLPKHLTSLQYLIIDRCPMMNDLPKHMLPSLLRLYIDGCPKLCKRYEGRGSHHYPLFSHIPRIYIDSVERGKKILNMCVGKTKLYKPQRETETNSRMEKIQQFRLTHVSFPTSATGGGGGQKLKSLDITHGKDQFEINDAIGDWLKKPMSEWGPQSFPSSLVELNWNHFQWVWNTSPPSKDETSAKTAAAFTFDFAHQRMPKTETKIWIELNEARRN
ncbi:hypothetical protein M8C21_009184, partial [Ambrosia artemisiifolia]